MISVSNAQKLPYKEKVELSLLTIKEASARAYESDTPLYIDFSGGKDSSCVLIMAEQVTTHIEAIYMLTGMELPGTIEYVREKAEMMDVHLHVTDPVRDYLGDFSYWVKRAGHFPTPNSLFCSGKLKLYPSRKYLRNLNGHREMYRLNGVRREESNRRKKIYESTPFIRPDRNLSGSFIVQPIQHWSGSDVHRFLEENKFQIQPDYKKFGVSGCAYCPFYQVEIYEKVLAVYPEIYDPIIELENQLGMPAVNKHIYLRDIKAKMLGCC